MSPKVTSAEIDEIERVESPTREDFFDNYVDRNKPVIITGVASHWNSAKWTPEYLKSVAGKSKVRVHFAKDKNFHSWYGTKSNRKRVEMTFGEYLDLQTEKHDERYYMAEYTLSEISNDFDGDFDPTRYKDVPAQIFAAWNSYMPLHYHGNTDTLLCQMIGSKQITLFHPDQFKFLYVHPWNSLSPYFSSVDLRDPDRFERFPEFRNAKQVAFTLHPGEMLFIPVHWWHVTAVPNAMSVSLTFIWHGKESNYTFPLPALHWYLSLAARTGNSAEAAKLIAMLGTPGPGFEGAAHSPAMTRVLADEAAVTKLSG